MQNLIVRTTFRCVDTSSPPPPAVTGGITEPHSRRHTTTCTRALPRNKSTLTSTAHNPGGDDCARRLLNSSKAKKPQINACARSYYEYLITSAETLWKSLTDKTPTPLTKRSPTRTHTKRTPARKAPPPPPRPPQNKPHMCRSFAPRSTAVQAATAVHAPLGVPRDNFRDETRRRGTVPQAGLMLVDSQGSVRHGTARGPVGMVRVYLVLPCARGYYCVKKVDGISKCRNCAI